MSTENTALTIGCVALTTTGIVSIAYGWLRWSVKVDQIELGEQYNSVAEVKTAAKKSKEQGLYNIYGKVQGTIYTTGEPLIAPNTKKRVVSYRVETTPRFSRKKQVEEMDIPFALKDSTGIFEVNTKGADLIDLETVYRSGMFYPLTAKKKEKVLEIARPLFIVGEIEYEPHGDRLRVKKPTYGKAFLITTNEPAEALAALRAKGRKYIVAGSVCLLAAAYCFSKIAINQVLTWAVFHTQQQQVGHLFVVA